MTTLPDAGVPILVLAPHGRDATVICRVLERVGLTAEACPRPRCAVDAARSGGGHRGDGRGAGRPGNAGRAGLGGAAAGVVRPAVHRAGHEASGSPQRRPGGRDQGPGPRRAAGAAAQCGKPGQRRAVRDPGPRPPAGDPPPDRHAGERGPGAHPGAAPDRDAVSCGLRGLPGVPVRDRGDGGRPLPARGLQPRRGTPDRAAQHRGGGAGGRGDAAGAAGRTRAGRDAALRRDGRDRRVYRGARLSRRRRHVRGDADPAAGAGWPDRAHPGRRAGRHGAEPAGAAGAAGAEAGGGGAADRRRRARLQQPAAGRAERPHAHGARPGPGHAARSWPTACGGRPSAAAS